MNGEGTKKDDFRAVGYLQKGVRLDEPFCTFLYAVCLEFGTGVKQDTGLARQNYKKAAEAGISEAQKWCKDHGMDVARPPAPKLVL